MVCPMLVGGPHQHAIAPGLNELLGEDSFSDASRATRWATFIASGSVDSVEFVAAHKHLADRDEALAAHRPGDEW